MDVIIYIIVMSTEELRNHIEENIDHEFWRDVLNTSFEKLANKLEIQQFEQNKNDLGLVNSLLENVDKIVEK